MRGKIGKKIFLITFLALIFLVSLILIFQRAFFEKFYINERNKSLVEAVENYRNGHSYLKDDRNSVFSSMYEFESQNNTKMCILSPEGQFIYISNNNASYGTDRLFNSIFNNLYLNNTKTISSGKVFTTTFDSKEFNSTITVTISSMSLFTQNDSVLMTVSSIQPIKEASTALTRFLPYFILGTLFIAVLYSMLLSKYIANPLTKLNKIAIKMSNMDFSERYTPKEDDEINNLGRTLNFLSENLHFALNELKTKNDILQEEVERERQIEEMRKSFIADVSHELKTPIGIIEGYAEGIRDNILKEENKNDYLNIIIDEAHKMNKLVMDMLELSKLQSGNIKPKFETFNIIRMIKGSLRKYNGLIKEKSLSVDFNPEFEYSYVNGDTFQIEQVLSNFLTNAIKYSPNNQNISITLEKLNNALLISIKNFGVTIPHEELDNIWSKFYRIDKSRIRDKNSSGLGLSITKGILDLHNSSYGIKNIDNGVLSYFTLPIVDDYDFE